MAEGVAPAINPFAHSQVQLACLPQSLQCPRHSWVASLPLETSRLIVPADQNARSSFQGPLWQQENHHGRSGYCPGRVWSQRVAETYTIACKCWLICTTALVHPIFPAPGLAIWRRSSSGTSSIFMAVNTSRNSGTFQRMMSRSWHLSTLQQKRPRQVFAQDRTVQLTFMRPVCSRPSIVSPFPVTGDYAMR